MTAQPDVEVTADELLARLKKINAMIRRGLAEAERGETEYLWEARVRRMALMAW